MFSFDRIEGRNLVTYKEFEFDFEPGISVIRGDNGSGKSLIFSGIPSVLFNTIPLEVSKGKASKKLIAKNSSYKIYGRTETDAWEIFQFKKSSSVQYDIIKNGINLNHHTLKEAENIIKHMFPINRSMFFSTLYLNCFRPSILAIGTPSQCYNELQDLFNFDIFDVIKKDIGVKLISLKEKYANKKYHKDRLDLISTNVSDTKALAKSLANFSNKSDIIQNKLNNANSQVQKFLQHKEMISLLSTALSADQLKDKIIKLEAKREELLEILESARDESRIYKEKYVEYCRYEKLLEEFEDFKDIDETSLEYFQSKLDKFNKIAQSFSGDITDIKEELSRLENDPVLKNIPVKSEYDVDYYKSKIYNLEDRVLKINKTLYSARDMKCPTCGAKVDKNHLNNEKYSIEKKLKQIHEHYDNAKNWKHYQDVVPKIKQLKKDLIKAKRIKSASAEAKLLEKTILNIKDKLDIIDELNTCKVKNMPKQKYDPVKIQKEIGEYDLTISDLKNNLKLLNKLKDTPDSQTIDDELNRWQEKLKEYTSDLSKIYNRIRELQLSHDKSESIDLEILELTEKVKDYSKLEESLKIYDALNAAYGQKGIRVAAINKVAEEFVARLNLHSPLLYSKPIKFLGEIKNNSFKLMAERNGMSPTEIAGTLSNGETRRFILLCQFALAVCLPKRLRSNTVILDEMEASFDGRAWGMYSDYINHLSTFFDNIIIITPVSENLLTFPESREYVVTKNKNESILRIK